MKYSPLQEIKKIKNADLCIDRKNLNPFRILCNETEGMSAYYFSCPIYDEREHRLINLSYQKNGNEFWGKGINARITISGNRVSLKNNFCKLDFLLPQENIRTHLTVRDFWGNERECLCDESNRMYLTYNGVAIETQQEKFSFRIDKNSDKLMQNGHFVACMANEFLPYATVAPLAEKTSGSEILPLCCTAEMSDDNVTVTFEKRPGSTILFTVDLYANKCVFDTTIESKNPDKNNSFGAVAVLGNSEMCGTQWLYSRLDVMQFVDLNSMIISGARLYSPCYNSADTEFGVYKMTESWCSFGSTWNSRILPSEKLTVTKNEGWYLVSDITEIVKDLIGLNMPRNPGIVMIPIQNDKNYRLISTGDNYFTPQMIEINLKKRG